MNPKNARSSALLTADAIINLVLGFLLVFFPNPLVGALGVPPTDAVFYPSILGAVLVGIGISLLLQKRNGFGGLGLVGAVLINLSGGVVLAFWLLLGRLELPVRGFAFLWTLVFLLIGISMLELITQYSNR